MGAQGCYTLLCYIYSCIIARPSDVGLPSLFIVALQYFTFFSSRMHIFKHSYLCTHARRGHYLVHLVLTFTMVMTYVYDKKSAPQADRGFLNDVQNTKLKL